MARQARIVIPGQAMHVLVRGNNREILFHEPADYTIYLDWLRTAAAQFSVAVHAYALMPIMYIYFLAQKSPSRYRN